MAISRFSTSTIKQGLPKYQKLWDQSSAIFSPSSISGLKLWLDASDTTTITSSGGAVSRWTDKSANAYTFDQSTSTNKPSTGVTTINGKNVLSYDGTNDTLISPLSSSTWNFLHNGSTNYTVFTVYKNTNPTNGGTHGLLSTNWDGSSSVVGVNYGLDTAGAYLVFIPSGSSGTYFIANTTGTATTSTTIRTDVIKFDSTTTNRWNLYINNGSVIQANTRSDGTTSNNATYTLQVGAQYSAGNGYGSFYGSIAEIIIYTSSLSDTDRGRVRDYLNAKWGAY